MRTGAYVSVSCIDHIRLEDPGWLCKLPGCLMVHAWPWDPALPVLGMPGHFARALAILGDGNDNRWD